MEVFEAGQKVMLLDGKGRRYLITLQQGGSFHFHRGIVAHDDIIGRADGCLVGSTGNETLSALRPTYADYVLKMSRGAQVIYPKDVATILVEADIFPGAAILEAGVGSGALTMALLRAVGPGGRVVAYDVREDHIANAVANIEAFLGKTDNLEVKMGSVYEPIPETGMDRVVLDLPEPWQALPHLKTTLRSGGILACYLPTVLQVHRLTEALQQDTGWVSIQTTETLVRRWHVEARSMRPEHRMVGHTGFLTLARVTSHSYNAGE